VQKEGHPACKNVWVMVYVGGGSLTGALQFARLVAPVVTTTSSSSGQIKSRMETF